MNGAFGHVGLRDPQPGIPLVVALGTQEGFRDPSLLDHAALPMSASWPPRDRVSGFRAIRTSIPRRWLRLLWLPLILRLGSLRLRSCGLEILIAGG